jgi:uncharacterized protein YaiE (UPF0345 family)
MTMSENANAQFGNVAVIKKANVYFDGKCVSHTVQFADGTRKSVGVILPSRLTFNTGTPEIMETVAGRCRVLLKNETEWKEYGLGESFSVPGDSSFEIEVSEPYHYVCHFG